MFTRNPKSKYGNDRVQSAGMSFQSNGERDCYQLLMLLERAGNIKFVKPQDHVYLTEARIAYVADFKVLDLEHGGQETWVEFKGFETDVWRIKRRLWMFYGPGPLWVYKGHGLRMNRVETITPKRETIPVT